MGKHTSRGGFTLIELIIYIGIFSIAAGLLTGVLTTFTRVQLRESATTAVSQEAQFVIQTIQRLVTDASLIELAKDSATSTLKLRMPTASLDPTCIQFSNGTVYLMQGNDGVNKQACFATSTAQAKTLTSSKVVVNSLTFKKFENPPSTDTVKIDLTISYNSTNPQESAISRTLQTAIAKVSAATFDSDIIPSADATYNVGISANRWKDGFFSGNVGIGTATPSNKLEVDGGSSAVVARISTTNTGSSAASLIISNSSKTAFNDGIQIIQGGGTTKFNDLAGTNLMTLDLSNARVGIGTAEPGTLLELSGPNTTGHLIMTNTVPGQSFNLGIDGGGTFRIDAPTWGTNRFAVTSSGNVGIGEPNPTAAKLQVNGSIYLNGSNGISSGGELLLSTYGTRDMRLRAGGIFRFQDVDAGNADRVVIDSSNGNVGIGIASPTSKLQVAGGDVGLGDATATGNQPVTVWLTNGSGVQRVAGEIVIIGGSDNSFTTTTTANNFQVLGVVYDSTIAIGAVGRVAIGGVVSVLSQGAVTRGNYLVTSTTAGKATHATSLASGQSALGRWLESLGVASTGRALIRY